MARASFLRRLVASKSIVRYKFIGARTAKINYSSKLSTNAFVRYVQSNGFFFWSEKCLLGSSWPPYNTHIGCRLFKLEV